jgi:hypothetical protein
MPTILIAQRDATFADALTTQLHDCGFRVISCPGPWPPVERCIRCDVGYCPLTEAADVMIYDPELTALDDHGERYSLAVDSADAHPDVPLLLAWPPDRVPPVDRIRAIRAQVPGAHVAARSTAGLDRQLHALLTQDRPAG